MTLESAFAKSVSLGLAAGVVVLGAWFGMPDRCIATDGGAGSAQAQMGSRFEDMSAGTLTPLAAENSARPALRHTAPEAPRALPQPMVAVRPVAALQPLGASVAAAAAQPAPALPAPVDPPGVLVAQPDTPAPDRSVRPLRKNTELAEKTAQARQNAAARTRKQTAVRDQTATRTRPDTKDTQSGGSSASASAQAGAGKAPVALRTGTAAASTYPGLVMKRISRIARPRVRAQGRAVISFSIAPGGGLARISVARSSGSSALDQAAVALIRKAAPFPRPPAGARRQFSITIKGQ
jgi:protein TonB